MASLHALGTVLALGERRYMVVGHRMTRDGERLGVGYVVVPYPLGFVGEESLSLVPASAGSEVVAEGLSTEAGADYLAQLEELARAEAETPYEAYAQGIALVREFVREEASDARGVS